MSWLSSNYERLIKLEQLLYSEYNYRNLYVGFSCKDEISNLIKPESKRNLYVFDTEDVLLGSPEQGFLEQAINNKLEYGKYQANCLAIKDNEYEPNSPNVLLNHSIFNYKKHITINDLNNMLLDVIEVYEKMGFQKVFYNKISANKIEIYRKTFLGEHYKLATCQIKEVIYNNKIYKYAMCNLYKTNKWYYS